MDFAWMGTVFYIIVIIVIMRIALDFIGDIFPSIPFGMFKRPKILKTIPRDALERLNRDMRISSKKCKPVGLNWMSLEGDEDTREIRKYARIVGMIADTRCYSFYIKFHWFGLSKWAIIPPSYLSSDVMGKEVWIKSRGLRKCGIWWAPVETVENKKHFKDYQLIRNYLDSLTLEQLGFDFIEQKTWSVLSSANPSRGVRQIIQRTEQVPTEYTRERESEVGEV